MSALGYLKRFLKVSSMLEAEELFSTKVVLCVSCIYGLYICWERRREGPSVAWHQKENRDQPRDSVKKACANGGGLCGEQKVSEQEVEGGFQGAKTSV
jgi:hypothetical protein